MDRRGKRFEELLLHESGEGSLGRGDEVRGEGGVELDDLGEKVGLARTEDDLKCEREARGRLGWTEHTLSSMSVMFMTKLTS